MTDDGKKGNEDLASSLCQHPYLHGSKTECHSAIKYALDAKDLAHVEALSVAHAELKVLAKDYAKVVGLDFLVHFPIAMKLLDAEDKQD